MRDLLRAIAVPRMHGTAAADRVASEIRSRLEGAGCSIEERPFNFSSWPARHGTLIAGTVLLATFSAAAWLTAAGRPAVAIALLSMPALATLVLVWASDRIILGCPLGRCRGTNLLATHPGGIPRFLVVAHRDSKSQPVPLAGRVGSAVAVVVGWLLLFALALRGDGPEALVIAAGSLGAVGGVTLACCRMGNDSDGALDNASGIAALLRIAHLEAGHGRGDVAYLVTDAEELGLAGARADARSFAGIDAVINLDGLDDRGPIVLIEGSSPLPGSRSPLIDAISACAARRGETVRNRALPPGLLLDHLPFSRAGHRALTIMRGDLRSLARVHRPADRSDSLTGTGSALVAAILSEALEEVRASGGAARA